MRVIYWLRKLNKKNAKIGDAKYIDVVKPMYNLIEYSHNYSKTSKVKPRDVQKY